MKLKWFVSMMGFFKFLSVLVIVLIWLLVWVYWSVFWNVVVCFVGLVFCFLSVLVFLIRCVILGWWNLESGLLISVSISFWVCFWLSFFSNVNVVFCVVGVCLVVWINFVSWFLFDVV